MTDKSDTRGLVECVKQQVDDFLDEALGPADPVTDKSDTRGLVDDAIGTVPRLKDRVALRALVADLAETEAENDRYSKLADAALSCVRRLLDGCWVYEQCIDGEMVPVWRWLPDGCVIPESEPMSPSEVHIIEMVRGEG